MKECIVLLDNGSLRPEPALNLRRIAAGLAARIGAAVDPVSLLHSSKIPAGKLGGIPADTWRRYLKRKVSEGVKRFHVVPLFFGPSSAIGDYLPKVTGKVLDEEGDAVVEIGNPLVDPESEGDDAVARMLRGLLIRKLDTIAQEQPLVILVDHGSPLRRVADCRNLVARQLERLLEGKAGGVIAASMERRDGAAYDFNEPLLAKALEWAREAGARRALLSLMFFSPGRHAGPGGDIEQIVSESRFVREGGVVGFAALAGDSPALIDILERRYRELREGRS